MADLTFYTNPMSRSRIVRWMLEETDADYDTEVLEFGPGMRSPEYLAINPMGKVPAIRHGDTVVTEGAAICAYLADAFPEAGLAPEAGSRERGPYYRWLFFAAGPLEQAVVNAGFGWTTEDQREQGRTGYGSLDRVADTLETLFADGRDFALGSEFSAVDVYLGSQIVWGLHYGSIPERPSLGPYAKRLVARPAAQRARQKDDALMPDRDG